MSRADRRRAEIARAAALLFERDGFHNVSVGDIAEAVGLSKATLYHYVDSKAEIVVWIHDELMEPLLERHERNVVEDVDPRAALRQILVDTIEFMETRPGYLRVFFENQREIPEQLRVHASGQRHRFQELVEVFIERGIERGLIRGPHPRLTALTLLGITNWSYQWYRPGGELPAAEVAQHLYGIFLEGAATEAGVAAPMPGLDEPITPSDEVEFTLSESASDELRKLVGTPNGRRGRQWRDHGQVIEAIAWKLQTGAAWRELPERFGPWRTAYGRFVRWRADGTWERIAELARKPGPLQHELSWALDVDAGDKPADASRAADGARGPTS